MSAAVKAIPDGFHSVNVYLIVPNAVEALEFYGRAFGAEQVSRMAGPDGVSTMHAEMRIGDTNVMLSDENPALGCKSPATLGGSPVSMYLYVQDADEAFQRAVDAGCQVKQPLMDAFWGDRYGNVTDPYGHSWGIGTHKEDVSPEELNRRAKEYFASMGGAACAESP